MLTLKKALRLYDLMKPYVKKLDEQGNSLDFIQGIIHQMNQTNPRDYCEVIAVVTGKNIQEVVDTMSTQERLQAFVEGLAENKIISLVRAIEKVGY